MAKNEFLPFGTAEGANVLSNQEYEALAARHNGFTSGVAKSKELNKVWRQASLIASAVAQFIVDTDQTDLLDNGNVLTIKSRLVSAMKEAFKSEMPVVPKTVQTTGTSASDVMSQKAVTDQLNTKASKDELSKKFDKTGGTISGPVEIESGGRALKMTAPKSDSAIYLEFFGGNTSVAFLGFGQDGTDSLTFANRKTGVVLRVSTDVSVNGVPVLLETDKTPVGMFGEFPHRAAQLPAKWYSVNGDRYSVSSPQGLALKSLPAQLKSDWGIVESGGMINVPNIKQSDGRTPFLRPVNGTSQQVGAVVGDQMRNLTGGVYFRQRQAESSGSSAILWNLGSEGEALTTREYSTTAGPVGLAGTGLQKTNTVELNARNQVPTGPEFKPLDIGVTLAIYLGV